MSSFGTLWHWPQPSLDASGYHSHFVRTDTQSGDECSAEKRHAAKLKGKGTGEKEGAERSLGEGRGKGEREGEDREGKGAMEIWGSGDMGNAAVPRGADGPKASGGACFSRRRLRTSMALHYRNAAMSSKCNR